MFLFTALTVGEFSLAIVANIELVGRREKCLLRRKDKSSLPIQ